MKYISRAKPSEKEEMFAIIEGENDFQKNFEPQGTNDDGTKFPFTYKLERVSGDYQMTAYKPDGERADNSWHYSFVRCLYCGAVNTYSGDDPTCFKCFRLLDGEE